MSRTYLIARSMFVVFLLSFSSCLYIEDISEPTLLGNWQLTASDIEIEVTDNLQDTSFVSLLKVFTYNGDMTFSFTETKFVIAGSLDISINTYFNGVVIHRESKIQRFDYEVFRYTVAGSQLVLVYSGENPDARLMDGIYEFEFDGYDDLVLKRIASEITQSSGTSEIRLAVSLRRNHDRELTPKCFPI